MRRSDTYSLDEIGGFVIGYLADMKSLVKGGLFGCGLTLMYLVKKLLFDGIAKGNIKEKKQMVYSNLVDLRWYQFLVGIVMR